MDWVVDATTRICLVLGPFGRNKLWNFGGTLPPFADVRTKVFDTIFWIILARNVNDVQGRMMKGGVGGLYF